MSANNDEQWLLQGKCSECRRKNYCKTQCTKNKRYSEASIKQAILNRTGLDEIYKGIERMY